MQSNLAYIDDVMERAIAQQALAPTLSEKQKDEAKKSALKVIAGFNLHDEAAERKALDDLIAKRREKIETFRKDRQELRKTLTDLGVTPLAILPTGAWYELCSRSQLFLINADKDGRIPIPNTAFEGYTEKQIVAIREQDWAGWLTKVFPGGQTAGTRGSIMAKIVLPQPPDDVAAILLKAQELPLQVAAVAEAISFHESPGELYRRANEKAPQRGKPFRGYKSYEEWLEKCPIVYTEHNSATGVIAQFGDFPIEKQVVDAVVATNDLVAERPKAVEEIRWFTGSLNDVYRSALVDAFTSFRTS